MFLCPTSLICLLYCLFTFSYVSLIISGDLLNDECFSSVLMTFDRKKSVSNYVCFVSGTHCSRSHQNSYPNLTLYNTPGEPKTYCNSYLFRKHKYFIYYLSITIISCSHKKTCVIILNSQMPCCYTFSSFY